LEGEMKHSVVALCYHLSVQPQLFTGACVSARYHMTPSQLWRDGISFGCMTHSLFIC
jgi:hypothetical protein